MSRLAFAILGLALAMGAASALAQNGIGYDCPATVNSWNIDPRIPAQYKNCNCPCKTCQPKCGSSYTPSASIPQTTGLNPSQAIATQLLGSFLNQLFSSAFSTNEPDTAQIQQNIAEEQARQKQEQDRLAELEAQQNKARQLEQEKRLQQGSDLLKEMHGVESSPSVESSTSVVSLGGKIDGFKWDSLAREKVESVSLSAGRYDTSGLKSWQRLLCAADFSKKALSVQNSDPEQARFFNEQADKVTAGETVEVACSFPPMPTVPEPPVPTPQMRQTEKNIQTVQLDLKELQGIETKAQKIQSDKAAAQEKLQQAEAALQQAEANKASANPEDAALMAEIKRQQDEAQAELDDANQKLKALSDQGQELSQQKEAIHQKLLQIQQQNGSGETSSPN
ncbi:MAG: hypothetical protein ABSC47_00975 [Terracidiphilus sp.]|jgi:hypothetical protein